MPAIHTLLFMASVTFSMALLTSARTLSSAVQSKYDSICQAQAAQNGLEDYQRWVWSDEAQSCASQASDYGIQVASLTRRNDQAAEACDEGLSKCLQDCAQYNLGSYENGESGAWLGCRASCSFRCSPARGGCWKGYCWAGCSTGFPLVEGIEWCYTTKTYSQSYQYVTCNNDSQCDLNWKCAGPCAAF